MTVKENFVSVELLRYFTFNVNLSLIVPALTILAFVVTMVRKNHIRRQYMRSYEQSVKDRYTILRRSCQWVYDHLVFPSVNLFNMLVVFSAVLLL